MVSKTDWTNALATGPGGPRGGVRGSGTAGAGESARISLELGATQLAFLDESEVLAVHPGEYERRVGHSAADIRQRDAFEVVGEKKPVPESGKRFFSETQIE